MYVFQRHFTYQAKATQRVCTGQKLTGYHSDLTVVCVSVWRERERERERESNLVFYAPSTFVVKEREIHQINKNNAKH